MFYKQLSIIIFEWQIQTELSTAKVTLYCQSNTPSTSTLVYFTKLLLYGNSFGAMQYIVGLWSKLRFSRWQISPWSFLEAFEARDI